MRRALRVLIGFAAGCLVAAYTALLFAITPAEITAIPWDAAVDRLVWVADTGWKLAFLFALFALPASSVAIAVGELRSIRSGAYYTVAGLAIALVGYCVQTSGVRLETPMVAATYAAIAYVATGSLAGSIYWLIAGRTAGPAAPSA